MPPERRPVLDRLFARVDFAGPCWVWQGATTRGYGSIGMGGKYGPTGYTHRVVWEHLVGPIPNALHLDHLCKNILCCNPDHLEPVSGPVNTSRSAAGKATGARNRAKTHCPHGHIYDVATTRVTARGRSCRACDRDRYYQRRESA